MLTVGKWVMGIVAGGLLHVLGNGSKLVHLQFGLVAGDNRQQYLLCTEYVGVV